MNINERDVIMLPDYWCWSVHQMPLSAVQLAQYAQVTYWLAFRNFLCSVHVSKTALLRLFSHLEILTLDLWTSNFQKCSTARISIFNWQKLLQGTLKLSDSSKTAFLSIFVNLMTFICDPQAFKNVLQCPINLFHWQKFLPGTLKCSYCSKMEFWPMFGHVVIMAFEPEIFRNA